MVMDFSFFLFLFLFIIIIIIIKHVALINDLNRLCLVDLCALFLLHFCTCTAHWSNFLLLKSQLFRSFVFLYSPFGCSPKKKKICFILVFNPPAKIKLFHFWCNCLLILNLFSVWNFILCTFCFVLCGHYQCQGDHTLWSRSYWIYSPCKAKKQKWKIMQL